MPNTSRMNGCANSIWVRTAAPEPVISLQMVFTLDSTYVGWPHGLQPWYAIFYAGLISQLITIVLRLPEKPRNTSRLIFLTLMVRTMVGEPCQGPEDEQGLQHSPQRRLRRLLQTKL